MKLILISFFRTKKIVIHPIADFHFMNVPTQPIDKASLVIYMASSLPAIAVAHPVDRAMILSYQK